MKGVSRLSSWKPPACMNHVSTVWVPRSHLPPPPSPHASVSCTLAIHATLPATQRGKLLFSESRAGWGTHHPWPPSDHRVHAALRMIHGGGAAHSAIATGHLWLLTSETRFLSPRH